MLGIEYGKPLLYVCTVYLLALTLFVGEQEGHPGVKCAQIIPKAVFYSYACMCVSVAPGSG